MSFTARVREELAHAPLGPVCCQTAEAVAMVRLGGALHVSGHGPGWTVDVGDGAVARRLLSALTGLVDVRPQVEVHQPTGLQRTRYRLSLPAPASPAMQRLGLLDADGRPVDIPAGLQTATPHDAAAFVRGTIMVAGSVSDPRRAPHLEIRTPGAATAELVRRLLVRCGATGPRAGERPEGWRVVSKSGASIGAVLARVGAHGSFLEWDGARLRRELRSDANRATNADGANLGRASAASGRHIAAIEAVVTEAGWDALDDDLRDTALARIANPEASLAELAELHTPAVAKATVHRRLERIVALAAARQEGAGSGR
jgi:cell division protein WhiA